MLLELPRNARRILAVQLDHIRHVVMLGSALRTIKHDEFGSSVLSTWIKRMDDTVNQVDRNLHLLSQAQSMRASGNNCGTWPVAPTRDRLFTLPRVPVSSQHGVSRYLAGANGRRGAHDA